MHSFLIIGGNEEIKRVRIDSVVKREKATRQIPFILQKIEDARVLKKIVKYYFYNKNYLVESSDTIFSHLKSNFAFSLFTYLYLFGFSITATMSYFSI